MSGPPRVKSMNVAQPETRFAGSKVRSVELQKSKAEKSIKLQDFEDCNGGKKSMEITPPIGLRRNSGGGATASLLRHRQSNLSMNASCSSDASTDSWQSRASTGRIVSRRTPQSPPLRRKQQCSPKLEKIEKTEGNGKCVEGECEGLVKRCAWVTSNTDPSYAAFHDEEWGLPVHHDKKLFEMLSFSTALAELTWPDILNKRHIFRDIFMDFDPIAVSKLNDKKVATAGSPGSSLLSELKLRSIIENARQTCKIIDELGSFDQYIWSFVNNKPIVGNFRYPRQVPIKTSKADTISKDLVRRGFRGVGPTVIYSFMQAVGITNDHLINCFRFHECAIVGDIKDKNEGITTDKPEKPEDLMGLELTTDIDDLSLSR